MKILVCNAGSTSLKFKLYQMPEEQVLAECRIERIADPKGGRFFYQGPEDVYKRQPRSSSRRWAARWARCFWRRRFARCWARPLARARRYGR